MGISKYYSEFVYGGVDGLITTFAIIAGSLGGNLSTKIVVILGLASILADGFSMGVSSYLAEKSRINANNAIKVAIITFLSFVCIGIFPLLPFLFHIKEPFTLSSIILGALLFLLGFLKEFKLFEGIETLLIGGAAAAIAYFVAKAISKYEDKLEKKEEEEDEKNIQ